MPKNIIFTREYWREAAKELKKPRILVIAALLIAVNVVLSNAFVKLPNGTRLQFDCVVQSLAAAIIGPVAGLVYAAAEDILSYLVYADGVYFPGYMFSAALGMVIYSLALYRQKVTVARLAVARLIINLVCNVGFNTLWFSILYKKAFLVRFWTNLPKNLIMWPVEVLLMMLVFRTLEEPLRKQGILRPVQSDKAR